MAMKRWQGIFSTMAICWLVAVGCSPGGNAEDQPPDEAASDATAVRPLEGVVTLDQSTQQAMGLKSVPLESQSVPGEVQAYGEVVDPVPLSSEVAEWVSAQTRLELSTREWERAKSLYQEHQNTSLRALQTAENVRTRDQVAAEAARWKLVAKWGQALAQRSDLSDFVMSLASLQSALVRVHLPAGGRLESAPVGAQLSTINEPGRLVRAEFIGRVPSVDPENQGQAFFFLVRSNALQLAPGAAVNAKMALGAEPVIGVALPDSAVIRYRKRAWVYVQTNTTEFRRRQVDLNHALDGGWLIRGTLKPGERVVVDGAQTLLSEELKSQIQLGD